MSTTEKDWSVWHSRVPDISLQEKIRENYKRSGAKTKSDFIRGRLLNKSFVVLHKDMNTASFVSQLENYREELRKIGVNLNQVTRSINQYHTVELGQILLEEVERLEKMIMLNQKKSIELTQELLDYLRK